MQIAFGVGKLSSFITGVFLVYSASHQPVSANDLGGNAERATFAKLVKASKPIKDAEDRIRYIVDLVDDELGKPARFANASEKITWKQAKSQLLIQDVTKLLDIKLLGSTSLVGTSFIAYLTEKQVEQFSKDSRVGLITEDSYLQSSALWNNAPEPNGQTTPQVWPWGMSALLTNGASSNGGATVYVLDTGVEMHADLPGLAATDRLTAFATDSSGTPINPTGCYSHATHVAGIIGAANDNKGTVGVLPGVRLVSVALGDSNSTTAQPCPLGSTTTTGSYNAAVSGYTQGLDKVYQRVLSGNQVGIVNFSFNSFPGTNQFGATTSLGAKMRMVATPTFEDGAGYKGALLIQSAGNRFENACDAAYDGTSTFDGILVVGGLDQNGQKVVPMAGLGLTTGFLSLPLADDEPGSNFNNGIRNCVEIWAPSQQVYSTWTGHSYAKLSGTSMAAPHVSGFAAWVLENDPYVTTSLDLEAAVRAKLVTINGTGLPMPRLTNTAVTASPTLDVLVNGNRALSGPLSFTKFETQPLDIKWEAVGASSCSVTVTRNGAYYSSQSLGTSGTLTTNVPGNPNAYLWAITCTSPQSTQTTVVVEGKVKRIVTVAEWYASTTSTYMSWQLIPHGSEVYWSIPGNASFSQFYNSAGADYCHIQSFGYLGQPNGDLEHPQRSTFAQYTQTLLWDSLVNGGTNFPPSGGFAPLNFGDTHNSPYGIAYYDGYKWRLECKNNDFGTITSKVTVMYGHGQ